jgi:prepilin-type N-terminal cleavage/methylation domain-containing protein
MAGRDRRLAPRPHRGPLRGEAGFTLIEVLIALFVLAVGILGAARLVASSEASTLDAELQQIATEEAEQAIEDVRALDYADIGHGTAGLPNGGNPYESPDAPGPEDLVSLGAGAGVVPSRAFEVERGGGKPPVTGTIETFVTWRDEECSLLDLSNLPGIATLRSRLTDLQTQISPLVGAGGLINSVGSQLTTKLINAIPSGQRPAYNSLKSELTAIGPLLETTSTQAQRVQALLDSLEGLEIDLCDLEPADLAGLQDLLSVNSSLLSSLTSKLVTVNSTLSALKGPLNTLSGYVNDPVYGTLVCGLLPTPNICGTVSSLVGPALNALVPSSGSPPKTIAGNVNTILADIDLDISGLNKDTTHNTKRITVAVTVDTGRDDITPANTIWLSSVVTDPDAGLIFTVGG